MYGSTQILQNTSKAKVSSYSFLIGLHKVAAIELESYVNDRLGVTLFEEVGQCGYFRDAWWV